CVCVCVRVRRATHMAVSCVLDPCYCLDHNVVSCVGAMANCFGSCSQEKYKRALADTENLRTRSQKMIEDAKLYGIQGFCHRERAQEEVTSQNPHLKNLYDGLVMTDSRSRSSPSTASRALFPAPVEGKEPGTVAVDQSGLQASRRTLRPALWGVAKAS
uniref:Uncharacterized protein n=1 Tax=Sander lucioperca TaxID=283035 RepID=A0A8C9ZMK6_SANLU